MNSSETTTYVIILILLAVALVLVGFIVTLLFLYQRRKHREDLKIRALQIEYAEELHRIRAEVYRDSFRDLAGEIHDNFGQKLAVILMKLLVSADNAREPEKESLEEIRKMLQMVADEMRQLSRNYYVAANGGFELPEAIRGELSRIEKLGIPQIDLEINGIPYFINETTSLFLYRMFQEILSNLLMHSQARHGKITLDYKETELRLQVADDGIGFDPEIVRTNKGVRVGLTNLSYRCNLLGGTLSIKSQPGNGTCIDISIPYQLNHHAHDKADRQNSNS